MLRCAHMPEVSRALAQEQQQRLHAQVLQRGGLLPAHAHMRMRAVIELPHMRMRAVVELRCGAPTRQGGLSRRAGEGGARAMTETNMDSCTTPGTWDFDLVLVPATNKTVSCTDSPSSRPDGSGSNRSRGYTSRSCASRASAVTGHARCCRRRTHVRTECLGLRVRSVRMQHPRTITAQPAQLHASLAAHDASMVVLCSKGERARRAQLRAHRSGRYQAMAAELLLRESVPAERDGEVRVQ